MGVRQGTVLCLTCPDKTENRPLSYLFLRGHADIILVLSVFC